MLNSEMFVNVNETAADSMIKEKDPQMTCMVYSC